MGYVGHAYAMFADMWKEVKLLAFLFCLQGGYFWPNSSTMFGLVKLHPLQY